MHDVQKTLADFRDHLARHDKPVAFLFGAGTSCAVEVASTHDTSKKEPLIPPVDRLTALCRIDVENLGDKFKKAWISIEDQCTRNQQNPNIDYILSRTRMMLNVLCDPDKLLDLTRAEIKILEESIRKSIARIVTPDLGRIPDELPHRKFAQWISKTSRQKPVEIFTVNYDILLEHALEAERIPTFDGFVGGFRPFFYPDSLRRLEAAPGSNWTRLWKMHGSVTWKRLQQDGRFRVVRGDPDPGGEMILPSFEKYDESRLQPYAAFTDRLSRFLEQDDALLVVAGFSFGDEHINNIVFGSLENRARTHVYALQFDELPDDNELIKRACQRSNMLVICPRTAVIGSRRAEWAPIESPPFMDDVFELRQAALGEARRDGDNSEPTIGQMRIGHFASFCNFLRSMTTS